MKKEKLKAKKGMTLIEVIISVTLLSILVVPLSGLVISSLKTNKDAEHKQKASYIGQKVLEELKAYDEITLKDDTGVKYFQLLDGDKIEKKSLSENKFTGSFKRTIYGATSEDSSKNEEVYNVDVEITQDSNFKYSDTDNLDKNSDADFKLNFLKKDNVNKIELDSDKNSVPSVSGDLIVELNKGSNNLNLRVYSKNNKSPIIDTTKKEAINNKILLYITNSFSENINVDIKNNTEEFIEIYVVKENNSFGKLNVTSSKGNVMLYEENEIEKSLIADMYKYKVTVKDKSNKVLFEGNSSKNINIK